MKKKQNSVCDWDTETSRRDFLNNASCAIFAALVASGVSIADASTFPINEIEADTAQGNERTYPLPSTDGVWIDKNNDVFLIRSIQFR